MLFSLTGGAPAHVNILVPQVTVTYAGSANCSEPSDCTGMVHTLNASVIYTGGGTTTKQTSGAYNSELSATSIGIGDTCDALIDPSSELCQGTIEGSATCSDVGALAPNSSAAFTTTGGSTYGLAVVGLKWNGTTDARDSTFGYCGVTPYCTAKTTPPLCSGPDYEGIPIPHNETLAGQCAVDGVWQLNNDGYVHINVAGFFQADICVNQPWGAIPLGADASPVECTPVP